MSYHNGSSSSSSSSSRSSSSSQRRAAPPGYHYMPDGSLMADSEMNSTSSTQRVAPTGFHYMPDGSLMSDDEMNTQQRVGLPDDPIRNPQKEPCIQQMSCIPGKTFWSNRHCACMYAEEISGPYDFGAPPRLANPNEELQQDNDERGGCKKQMSCALGYAWSWRACDCVPLEAGFPFFGGRMADPNYGSTEQRDMKDGNIVVIWPKVKIDFNAKNFAENYSCNVNKPYSDPLTPKSKYQFRIWELCATNQINGPYPPGTPTPVVMPVGSTAGMPSQTITYNTGDLVGPFKFYGNPLFDSSQPGYPDPAFMQFNLFYDWAVQEVGPIAIGDKIELDISAVQDAWFQPVGSGATHPFSSTCTASLTNGLASGQTNKLCLTYLGETIGPNTPLWPGSGGLMVNNTVGAVSLDTCDCKRFGIEDPIAVSTGWICAKKPPINYSNPLYPGGIATSLNFGSFPKCLEVFSPQLGLYQTEQDCINSGCEIVIGPNDPSPVLPYALRVIESSGEKSERNEKIKGYTLLPSGDLVKDELYEQLYNLNNKTLLSFIFDFSDLSAATETRPLKIIGTQGSDFKLEIKNEDNHYYNFYTKAFQAGETSLEDTLVDTSYIVDVIFPTVTDNDQYDISIYAVGETKHAERNEIRFGDNSIDINSSTGSNSLLMEKVIYQYTDLTLTITPYSPNGSIAGTATSSTVTLPRANFNSAASFSTTFVCGNTASLQIIKQPITDDIFSFVSPVIGSAPLTIQGENIYPTATAAFTGDDVNGVVTSGAIVEIDADVAGNVVIGDKITTPVTTDTVDMAGGRGSDGVAITMDSAVATKMAVGDQVTGNAALNAGVFTVAAIASTNVFNLSSAVAIADGVTLTFSSKINRSLTTVLNLDPSGEAKQFTMSQDIQFRDNAPLTFFNQMNYRWPINNFANIIKKDMIVVDAANVETTSVISDYKDFITLNENTVDEYEFVNVERKAVDTLAKTPTIVRGLVTTQEGAIIFNKQQPLALAGDTIQVGGYGETKFQKIHGYDVILSNLKVVLTTTTTTTTSAVNNSTSVPVTSRNGILDSVSTVSGIGIDCKTATPTVASGAGAVSGAGTIVLSAAQTIENGTTLTFGKTSLTATISGDILINNIGVSNQSLLIDIEKLLSIT